MEWRNHLFLGYIFEINLLSSSNLVVKGVWSAEDSWLKCHFECGTKNGNGENFSCSIWRKLCDSQAETTRICHSQLDYNSVRAFSIILSIKMA